MMIKDKTLEGNIYGYGFKLCKTVFNVLYLLNQFSRFNQLMVLNQSIIIIKTFYQTS